ncbi:MAG: DUF4932 domain-containing protein [Deltaproteobacteria bacterium]|nr:DUF4932 domain-containing protein [Deltaproteobacteria bacterium]
MVRARCCPRAAAVSLTGAARVAVAVAVGALLVGAGCGGRKRGPARAVDAGVAPRTGGPLISTDARVELLSILFRLAGAPEYNKGSQTPYLAAALAHFGRFADHPAVLASRQLRQQSGIGYNAPVGLAVYLDPTTLTPLVPMQPLPSGLDVRWRGVAMADYLDKVRDFATRSDFAGFFATQRPYLTRVEARMSAALAGHDSASWLERWFGAAPFGSFVIIPGLITGAWNYGASTTTPGAGHTAFQVVQLERPDAEGLPQPSDDTLALLAHEMSHSFVNPIIEDHAAALEPAATPLFTAVQAAMTRSTYPSWLLMVQESCVRAVTLLYARAELGPAAARATLARDRDAGFTWIEALAEMLEAQRAGLADAGAGSSLEAMVPALAAFFSSQAPPAASPGP